MTDRASYQKPAGNGPSRVLEHGVIPVVEARKTFLESIFHIHPRKAVHSEGNRFRPLKVPPLVAEVVDLLWYLNPVTHWDWSWRLKG